MNGRVAGRLFLLLALVLALSGCNEAVSVGAQVVALNFAPTPVTQKLSAVAATPVPTPVPSPTPTPVPTPTSTPVPTPTATPEPTETPEQTATLTPVKKVTPTPSEKPEKAEKPTEKPEKTEKPTEKPTATPEERPTERPTATPAADAVFVPAALPESAKPTPIASEAASTGKYTHAELELAARVALWEARGKGEEAYRAVLSVILNRCESKKFGGGLTSISTEVYRKSQFSVVRYDDFKNDTAPDELIRYADDVFNGKNRKVPEGVLFFRSASLGKSWGDKTYYETIGGNAFFFAG